MNYIFSVIIILLSVTSFANSSSWQYVADYEGVKLYSMDHGENGLLPFKATRLSKYSVDHFVKLLVDYEHKSQWAPKLKETKLHKELGDNKYIFSEFYSTPWPFYDREFLLQGNIFRKGKSVVFEGVQLEKNDLKDEEHVLANVRALVVTLTPQGNGTFIEFEFIGDMGGVIPHFVSNIIQKKWPVRFIQAMEKTIESGNIRETKAYNSFMKI